MELFYSFFLFSGFIVPSPVFFRFAISLILGVLLDRIFADPGISWHPVRLIGGWISFLEGRFNTGSAGRRRFAGFIVVILTILPVWLFFLVFELFLESFSFALNLSGEGGHFVFYEDILAIFWNGSFVFLFLASEGLLRAGRSVLEGLERSLQDGRERLSGIVGRDTENLEQQGVRRAVLESMSENLSDGVIAPLFFFFLGGIPLLAVYKAINTLDSMIAYRNERFFHFGWAAAKLDDIANYIPARLTALLLVIVSGKFSALRTVWRFASLHESPNSGYPESALAGILGLRLGGPAIYHGAEKQKAWLGDVERDCNSRDFVKTVILNRRVLYSMVFLGISLRLILDRMIYSL